MYQNSVGNTCSTSLTGVKWNYKTMSKHLFSWTIGWLNVISGRLCNKDSIARHHWNLDQKLIYCSNACRICNWSPLAPEPITGQQIALCYFNFKDVKYNIAVINLQRPCTRGSGPVFYLCLRTVLDSKNLISLLTKIISFYVCLNNSILDRC